MREEFKACSNCKHFKKLYIKGKSDYYVASGCGVCDIKFFPTTKGLSCRTNIYAKTGGSRKAEIAI